MRNRLGWLLAALCMGVVVAVAPQPPAERVEPLELVDYQYTPPQVATLAGGRDIVVDEGHDQVFVAQQRSGLLVTDLDGAPVTTIAMAGWQDDLSMSEDGSTVFATVRSATGSTQSIVAVDTVTYGVSTIAPGNVDDCPIHRLTQHGGLLWFATTCRTDPDKVFGYVDPADGAVVRLPVPPAVDLDLIHRIVGVPDRPDRLLVASTNGVSLVEITYGETVAADQIASSSQRSSSIAVTPDGSEILLDHESYVYRLSATDLSTIGSIQVGATDLAVGPDGTVAFGSGDQVSFYRPGLAQRIRAYQLGDPSAYTTGIRARGLEWGADRLYAIVDDKELYAFPVRRRTYVGLRVEERRFAYGEAVSINVILDGPTANRDVVIWSVDRRGVRRQVAELTIPRSADLNLRTTVVARRSGHFEVTYAGDDSWDPSWDRAQDMRVAAKVVTEMRSGRMAGGVRLHRVDEPVIVRGKVLPNHARECLHFNIDVLAGGRWRDVDNHCVRLDQRSKAAIGLRGARRIAGFKFRVWAYYGGDRINEADSGRYHYFKFVR
ncbi:hypothetical protein [Nocardioides pelophilus]|uniref:hypothetical protein n=1 Tax=Nocardioides pelophilus TaxID=2172019 RepID=UPI0015FFCC1D|nr:hypothetical protein [Nocardioides pelophilus]